VRFNRAQEGVPLILVDGIEIEQEELEIIAPENVAKIETINTSRAAVFGSRGANGAIIIYTKEGILNKKIKTFNSIADKIQGYQDTRVFYSPNYEEPDTLKENLADVRNTLYWNPYLHPDEDGNAKATYFNSDVKTNVNIIVEGITTTGIPLVVRSTYRVE
jgi:hypothetical protein